MTAVFIRVLPILMGLVACASPTPRSVPRAGADKVSAAAPRAPAQSAPEHRLVRTFRAFVACQKKIATSAGPEWASCFAPYVVNDAARSEFFARFLLSVDHIRDEHACSDSERAFARGYPEQTEDAVCFLYGEKGERGIAFFVIENGVPRVFSLFGQ